MRLIQLPGTCLGGGGGVTLAVEKKRKDEVLAKTRTHPALIAKESFRGTGKNPLIWI